MVNINVEDLIEVVEQPEYSKAKLIGYQNKYCIDTISFYEWYTEGIPLPMDTRDIQSWVYHYKMFAICEGNIDDLFTSYYDTQALIA